MTEDVRDGKGAIRRLSILAFVNVGIWAIALVALVFVLQGGAGARGMFPILGGGAAVGIALLGALTRARVQSQ